MSQTIISNPLDLTPIIIYKTKIIKTEWNKRDEQLLGWTIVIGHTVRALLKMLFVGEVPDSPSMDANQKVQLSWTTLLPEVDSSTEGSLRITKDPIIC